MSWLAQSTIFAALASLAAGAALLELARIPRSLRMRGRRPSRTAAAGARSHVRWAADAGADARVERLLDAAGRIGIPDAAALAARRRVTALVGGAWAGALVWLALPPVVALAACAAGAAAGHVLPEVALRRAGQRRAAQLRDETPEMLDLLAVALRCGLPIRAAMETTGRWGGGELAAGIRRAAAELDRGAGIDQTLARLLREHPTAELDAAVAILQRSRAHGTAASAPLRALATSARHARARRALEHAARAAPRVQLVAALLLVPAALCVLAASIVAGGFG